MNRSDLVALEIFLAIARHLSFGRAADSLGISSSAASHAMRGLEERLGVRLVNRTSRSVQLTDAGRALAERAGRGMEEIRTGFEALDAFRAAPRGVIRINALRDAARLVLGPVLAEFTRSYPEVELDLTIDDHMVDVTALGADAGIRYRDTVPEDMIAIPLSPPLDWVIAGAPAYLDRMGRPETEADLARHSCIRIRVGDGRHWRWELGSGAAMRRFDPPGPLTLNEGDAIVQATLDGVGLGYVLRAAAAPLIAAGRLEVVLPESASEGPPFCLYCSSRQQMPGGLRALIDLIRLRDPLGRGLQS